MKNKSAEVLLVSAKIFDIKFLEKYDFNIIFTNKANVNKGIV